MDGNLNRIVTNKKLMNMSISQKGELKVSRIYCGDLEVLDVEQSWGLRGSAGAQVCTGTEARSFRLSASCNLNRGLPLPSFGGNSEWTSEIG